MLKALKESALRGRHALRALGLSLQHFSAPLDLLCSLLGRSTLSARLR
jgi:hypothetical protein